MRWRQAQACGTREEIDHQRRDRGRCSKQRNGQWKQGGADFIKGGWMWPKCRLARGSTSEPDEEILWEESKKASAKDWYDQSYLGK